MFFNTLYGKLIAVLVCLVVTMAVMFLMVIQYSDNMRRQKTNQVIYRTLAAQFVNEHYAMAPENFCAPGITTF